MKLLTIENIDELFPMSRQSVNLQTKDAATFIGVHQNTLRYWTSLALGPKYIKINNGRKAKVLYPKNELISWLEENTATTV